MIHIEHLTSVVRVYAPGASYEAGSEPCAVATLCRVDTRTVEVMAAMGRLTRTAMREIARSLAAAGVKVLVIKRAGKHRMPYGRLTKVHGPFHYYEIEVEGV